MDQAKQVRVGVGVFIFKDHKFLMLKRKGAHGSGSWSIPGGHMEFGESLADTAKREAKEETGLEVTNVRFGAYTNDFFAKENKHYITIWAVCDYLSGEEKITEPDKCTAQSWQTFDNLPLPLFVPWQNLLESEFIDPLKELLKD
jgi:8-oxo-dGTP diphosphatase